MLRSKRTQGLIEAVGLFGQRVNGHTVLLGDTALLQLVTRDLLLKY